MANNDVNQTGKTWELSLYELHRTPQEIITDNTEIAVSPRSLHSELMCPICLDMLKMTMTTKECLHRFCQDCIITALRSGNKECPTCRKKLISKRSLRHDPNFDNLIAKIYPSREDYEAQQERVMAKVSKHNFVQNIEETLRMQALNRSRGKRTTQEVETDSATPIVPSQITQKPGTPLSAGTGDESDPDGHWQYDTEEVDEDNNDVELIIKPLPQVIRKDSSQTQVRFIKTTIYALVTHIAKYLEMRCDFEGFPQMESNGYANGDSNNQTDANNCDNSTGNNNNSTTNVNGLVNGNNSNSNPRVVPHEFTMYIAGGPGQFNPVPGHLDLATVHEKYWKLNKPLELYYAYKMEQPTPIDKGFGSKNGTHKTSW